MLLGHVFPLQCVTLVTCVTAAVCACCSWSYRPCTITFAILLHIAAGIDSLSPDTLDPAYWGHAWPAVLLMLCARAAASSPGRLTLFFWPAAASITLLLGAVAWEAGIEVSQHGRVSFTSWIHILVYVLIMCTIGASAAPASDLHPPARFTVPCSLGALGVIFIRHEHERSGLGMEMHRVLGHCLMLIAVAHFGSAVVHEHDGRAEALLPTIARHVHCFSWSLAGVWLLLMTVLFYTRRMPGWHDIVGFASSPTVTANEQSVAQAIGTLFAFALLLAGVLVDVLSRLGAMRVERPVAAEAGGGHAAAREGSGLSSGLL